MTTKQLCTFRLDGHFFGIDILQVQEIIRRQELTRVPLAPSVIEGLVNLRGQIVIAIDMRLRLELPPRAADCKPTHVVVRADDGLASLMVDEIGDMMELPDHAFEMPPDSLHGPARELITGVYKLEKDILLVLDTTKTVSLDLKMVN